MFTPFGWFTFSDVMSSTFGDRIFTSGFIALISVGAKLNFDKIFRNMVKSYG